MKLCLFILGLFLSQLALAQDTFSIVAVDEATGEVGSAGASCISADNLKAYFPDADADFLGDLLPGTAAINTQSYYLPENQQAARQLLLQGLSPAEAIMWLAANDAHGTSAQRQYGIAALIGGKAHAAAFTGDSCLAERGHRSGTNYAIQGNILLREALLDSMEQAFLTTEGCLSAKLMAAMQAANFAGADSRCLSNGTSSMFAFLKVARPGDSPSSPQLRIFTAFNADGSEPIDALQEKYDALGPCGILGR